MNGLIESRNILVVVMLFFSPFIKAEDCFYLVQQSALIETTVNGQSGYQLPKQSLIQQCLTLEDVQRLDQMAQALAQSQQLSDDYQQLNQKYQALLTKNESTLSNVINLTRKYDAQIASYQGLLGDHIDLVNRYDELATGYRDVALNRSSTISLEIGAGSNADGDISGLLGLGWRRARAWAVFQEEQTIYLLGLTMPF